MLNSLLPFQHIGQPSAILEAKHPPSLINKLFNTTEGLKEPAELASTTPASDPAPLITKCGMKHEPKTTCCCHAASLHLPDRGFNSSPAGETLSLSLRL